MSELVRRLLIGLAIASLGPAANAEPPKSFAPPDPYRILGVDLAAPTIDAVGPCSTPAPEPAAETPLAMAIRAAREASDSVGRSTARKTLRATLDAAEEEPLIPCGWLELARLEHLEGRAPEASVSAQRALHHLERESDSAPVRRAASFYRAEALMAAGDRDKTLEMFRELAGGGTPVARAAQLRLADSLQTLKPSPEHRRAVEEQLAKTPGAAAADWAPRISEWALAEADLDAAAHWLEIAADDERPGSDRLTGAIAIRRADLLAARGDRDDAIHALRELAERGRAPEVRRLALVRAVDLGRRQDDAALQRLERSANSGTPRLRSYANLVLARHSIQTGHLQRALDLLVRLVHTRVDEPDSEQLTQLFDKTTTAMSRSRSCDEWTAAVGGRRDLLLRYTADPEPFLRLGDCYMELGMASAALETYRGVAKSFGPSVVRDLTFRSARAEHRLGRTSSARAAARASVKTGAEPRGDWRLLYAEILLSDGHAQEALDVLRPALVPTDESGSVEPLEDRTLWVGARAALHARPDAVLADRLHRTIFERLHSGSDAASLPEAALLVADLQRSAGDLAAARLLYGVALATLDPGAPRSRAGYWHGMLSPHPERARDAWAQVAEGSDPWARLAANEIGLAAGRAEVGERSQVPESRRPRSATGESR